jgi:hypothetical protein
MEMRQHEYANTLRICNRILYTTSNLVDDRKILPKGCQRGSQHAQRKAQCVYERLETQEKIQLSSADGADDAFIKDPSLPGTRHRDTFGSPIIPRNRIVPLS